jgi:hypothetical protein
MSKRVSNLKIFRSDGLGEARRAVATSGLGWRLGVELMTIGRFGPALSPIEVEGVMGQSPLPALPVGATNKTERIA